jgi:hypothetical protein
LGRLQSWGAIPICILADELIEVVKVTYIEEVKLIRCAANASCEEEHVSLQPRDFHWGILETCSWTRHFVYLLVLILQLKWRIVIEKYEM